MMSSMIRAYNLQNNRPKSILLYKNTETGLFSFSDMETEVNEKLVPLEKLSLDLIENLGSMTRIEVSIVSGISLDVCDNILAELQISGLIEIREYDKKLLENNLNEIEKEIGDEWRTPYVKEMISKNFLKQFIITNKGREANTKGSKTIIKNTKLNMMIVGDPFHLFYDKVNLRADGYEVVKINNNTTKNILNISEDFSNYTGIKPIAISSSTVIEGKEVTNSQFWVTGEERNGEINYKTYLTSRAFERWVEVPWDERILEKLPEFETMKNLIVKSMAETWGMVDDVIEEGLELLEDNLHWRLSADLEMQKLIFANMNGPIIDHRAEVRLKIPDSNWKVVIMLELDSWDELSEQSLMAGRFHNVVTKKGFDQDQGFKTYTKIIEERGLEVNRQNYLELIKTLVENECLIERLSKIEKIYVDLDDVLRDNRKSSDKLKSYKIEYLFDFFRLHEIDDVQYFGSSNLSKRIDDTEKYEKLVSENKILIYEEDNESYVLEKAREDKTYYLGSKNIKKNNKEQDYSRALKPKWRNDYVSISGVEPFYDLRLENIFDRLYQKYYE